MNKIEIPLSKTKLLLGLAGSILFILLGLYLWTVVAGQQTGINATLVKVVGLAGMLFFGATGIYGVKKLFDKSVGLTIDENGITDNTNASSIGLIKWDDITEIQTAKVMSTQFLLIFTRDSHAILENASGMKRKLLERNLKMYGTPLSISSTTLMYHFNDLETLVKDRFNEYREKKTKR